MTYNFYNIEVVDEPKTLASGKEINKRNYILTYITTCKYTDIITFIKLYNELEKKYNKVIYLESNAEGNSTFYARKKGYKVGKGKYYI